MSAGSGFGWPTSDNGVYGTGSIGPFETTGSLAAGRGDRCGERDGDRVDWLIGERTGQDRVVLTLSVLVDPSPQAHVELARFAVLDGKTWNTPALAGSRSLVRNDREAARYGLPLEPQAVSGAAAIEPRRPASRKTM